MPFDNPPPEAESPALWAEAANLIELGMTRIATPDRWCKDILMQIENGNVQRCVLGSFILDDSGERFALRTDARILAKKALNTVAERRGFTLVADFNNAAETTHAHVLDAMREAVRDLRG